jgi:DNA-binding response OmpR family regulator
LETAAIAPTIPGKFPRYDLVLTDLNLPDGSGKTLLAKARSQRLPFPVVVLTGSGSEETLVPLLRAGADDYVIKRSNFHDTLALVLRAALDKVHTETFRRAAALRILYVEPNACDIDLAKRELASIAPHLHIESLQTAEQVLHRLRRLIRKSAPMSFYHLCA